jgi:TetR/AcrR family transcriptional regulator, transcriptional repressor for nem operon
MERESTRERLIAAALKLFGEKGYQSTSVADVQRESDCHSGSFYHFFPTKQALLLAVLERYRTRDRTHAHRACVGQGQRSD